MKIKSFYLAFMAVILSGLILLSCEKDEGKGGTSSVSGKVLIRRYNTNFTVKTDEYYATDEKVFIIYGDDVIVNDETSTNWDGTYRFDYLREGNYIIFAYSGDSALYPTKHEIPIMKQIEIKRKNQNITVPDIIILKNQ
jgi:hypothetical protein